MSGKDGKDLQTSESPEKSMKKSTKLVKKNVTKRTQQNQLEGFYSAYFSGTAGNSFGVFVFKDGLIRGADAGGGIYKGSYETVENEDSFKGNIIFLLSPGSYTITGMENGSEPVILEVPIKLPVILRKTDVHRIETPNGPINAKFDKISGF
ncbi:hypothetical protein [Litorimonas haliclonae]|uniref:hypothetical protein n=1 Tax=Litorimonas haliclonae TaxID=2081977 RepID=UPI0039EFA74D